MIEKRTCILVFVVLVITGLAFGEIPRVINYQGKVTDLSGVPVADGSYDMTFRMYDAESGGSEEWNSGPMGLSVE